MPWLVLLFFVVPLLELYLILVIGGLIGFWPTMAIMLGSALLGGALAKHEGLRVWREWRRALERLEPPTAGVVEGVLVLIGGALLIAPGLITDTAGLLLLFPPSRRLVARRIRAAVNRKIAEGRLQVMTFDVRGAPRMDGSGAVDTAGEAVDDAARPTAR